MQVDILFFEGCPHRRRASALVRDVVRALGIVATVREIEVRDAPEAVRLRFFGSPTIQVDGCDIDPRMRDRSDYSFTCRMYGAGGVSPRALVERALTGRDRSPPTGGEAS